MSLRQARIGGQSHLAKPLPASPLAQQGGKVVDGDSGG